VQSFSRSRNEFSSEHTQNTTAAMKVSNRTETDQKLFQQIKFLSFHA
jgi:hypothetical protein